mmetsp:Transcript_29685/g.53878  ORF Transcript_29685/g.53878 Transcript_29685/m.53878 type:complete len:231 (+) Transcript_29685:2075-2767(+)
MAGLCLDIVEFAHAKGDEVGRHDGSIQKSELLLRTPRKSFVGELGHVAKDIHVFRHGERDSEDGFAGGFVPAWKGTPGIQALKLSTSHDLTLPVNIRVAAPVKSSHLIVQKSSVLNFQNQGSIGRKHTPKHKRHRRRLHINPNFLHLVHLLATFALDHVRGSREAQLLGVHGNVIADVGGGGHFDGGLARKSEILEVGGEFEVVADGVDGWGEEDAAFGFGGCHGGVLLE